MTQSAAKRDQSNQAANVLVGKTDAAAKEELVILVDDTGANHGSLVKENTT